MTNNSGPVIHNGVVLHGVTLAPSAQITYLVTSQAIIPAVLPQNLVQDPILPEQNILKNT